MPSEIFRPGLLRGQVALVSGGGSGIGRATAVELATLGAQVVICGRREEPLRETAALIDALPETGEGSCAAIPCDIREPDRVADLLDAVATRHGRIDLLVNNAGGQFLAPAEEITPKGFHTVIRLNVEGTWLLTHAVATRMMIPDGRGGRIVNLTISPHNGLPGMAHSSAARAAVENLTRVLSVEWSRFQIRINAIAVGQVATETLTTKYPAAIVEGLADTIPLGRLGRPEDVAWLIAHLASPAGDFISGAVLTVDGARDNWLGRWPPAVAADETGRPLSEARPSNRPATT